MRLIYYSLARAEHSDYDSQWIQSIRSLRRHNSTTSVSLFLFNGASEDLLHEAARCGVTIRALGDYREYLMPGMIAMTMVFGIGATLSAVSADAARGVIDRFRSLPMSAPAVIAGRAAADMLNSAAALAVLTGCGFAAGWHPHRGAARAIAALGLLLLLRFAFLWVGVYLGLRFYPNPEAVTAVRTLEFPLGFLGNPFVAVSTMPAWLGAIALWNPLSSTVTAARQLFGDPIGANSSWITSHAIIMAVAWPLLLTAVFFPLSLRRYQRLSR